ncbi:MAG: hypothetical protein KDD25_01680 [Bdellovibrionales bacterium]|nr:hypothetical protein [Bdellovibrionales bacterium]
MKLIAFLLSACLANTALADNISTQCDQKIDDSVIEQFNEDGVTDIEPYAYAFGIAEDEVGFYINGIQIPDELFSYVRDDENGEYIVRTSLGDGPFSPQNEFHFDVAGCSDGKASLFVVNKGGYYSKPKSDDPNSNRIQCVCSED